MKTSKQSSCAITVRLSPAEKEQLMVMAQLESRSVDKQARLLILKAMGTHNMHAVTQLPTTASVI